MTPEQFITRWQNADGSERANYQIFIADLCELLELPKPDPARDDTRDNAYVFERRITLRPGDGGSPSGFIDCYPPGPFVLLSPARRCVCSEQLLCFRPYSSVSVFEQRHEQPRCRTIDRLD